LLLESDEVEKPPFDRVILYIDDLDRCRADLVVQVLEAVHLLLALKLFVVVVGVDPRWLAQSLKRHYIGQLGLEDGNADGDEPDGEVDNWATTPQNYLEKIFQIPFALQPMGTEGYKRMVGELFEVRTVESGPDGSGSASVAQTDGTENGGHPVAVDDVTAVTPGETQIPMERARELLRIWPAELEFIQRLGELIPTPRAANRLANTYRLIRVKQDGHDLARFVKHDGEAGEYQVALVLLAIVVGFSEIADDVFRRLLNGKQRSFWPFVETLAAPEDAKPRVAETYESLRDGLRALREETELPAEIRIYREWVPRISRYSFETARNS
jgi:hypothetical protein